jgi:hypothetical protein
MTVVKTHLGLCLFGVRMRRAMQMQTDAMTAIVLVGAPALVMWRHTVDRRKPENDTVEPIGRERTYRPKQTQYENGKKYSLICLST